ncbi:glycosyltransferase family 4 protein [Sessilibacter sp. MAH1]
MRILQVLPELNSGGVERGTVEFGAYLQRHGHESHVISAGGRLVNQLQQEGSIHHQLPVHKKSLLSVRWVPRLRRLIEEISPDIIHVRSRMPAWLTWLAIKNATARPALVSTFHGLYSVNRYSEIMGCGDQVIAVSEYVKNYIVNSYPRIDAEKISVIHRGVDTDRFQLGYQPDAEWFLRFHQEYPHLKDQPIVLMPGRLSAWKGHEHFIALMKRLKQQGIQAQGVIVGGPTPGKEAYEQHLHNLVDQENLNDVVTFLGHRSDIQNLYSISTIVCNLSEKPEPFGRTVIEALALGKMVVAFDEAGPGESLAECFPSGLVAKGDENGLFSCVTRLLKDPQPAFIKENFTLQYQAEQTLAVYERALSLRHRE